MVWLGSAQLTFVIKYFSWFLFPLQIIARQRRQGFEPIIFAIQCETAVKLSSRHKQTSTVTAEDVRETVFSIPRTWLFVTESRHTLFEMRMKATRQRTFRKKKKKLESLKILHQSTDDDVTLVALIWVTDNFFGTVTGLQSFCCIF